ncbi:MAG: tetratricopeptide repeat protein [Caulobacteraceae bacterium]
MNHPLKIAAFAAALAAMSGAAHASTMMVGGGGLGRDCYLAAKAHESSGRAQPSDLNICTLALDGALSPRDRAATFVNRGIMQMSRQAYAEARADYDAALRIQPNLAEAHVNRGASLIGLGQNAEGVAAIDRGLALGATQPEKAYFNRALAKERLGDVKGAYLDFAEAARLAPAWAAPQRELARFTVTRPAHG